MFRAMRRLKQSLPLADSIAILERNTSGVLAVSGDDDYPYAVPLSFIYQNGKLYFHCAKSGHKLDAIAKNPKVSFCIIDQDTIVPKEYTTYFRSVIVFGQACLLQDEAEKRAILQKLGAKYAPHEPQGLLQEIDSQIKHTNIIALTIEHISGKEAIELVKAKKVE